VSRLVPRALQNSKGRIDWGKLNYILIPSAQRATQTLPWPPTQGLGRSLFRAYSAFTREGRFLLVMLLLIALFSGDVAHTQVYVLFSALASLLGASVLVSRFLRVGAGPAGIRIAAPERAFVGDSIDIHVSCTLTHDTRLRYERPFLPYFAQWLPSPSQDGPSSVHRVRFRKRGMITLGRFYVSRLGPLDLSSGPATQSEALTLRIAPRPANVVKLSLPGMHGAAQTRLSPTSGDAMLLRGLREYVRGDRLKRISTRAWERTGRPMVREYYSEPTLRVGIVVLASGDDERELEALLQLTGGVVAHVAKHAEVSALALGSVVLRNCSQGRTLDALAGFDPKGETAEEILAALSAARDLTWILLTNQAGARENTLIEALKPVRVLSVGAETAPSGLDMSAIERGAPLAL
jgi:uncharacterized protein (DUF58 family)